MLQDKAALKMTTSTTSEQWQTALDGIENLRLSTATVAPPAPHQLLVRIHAVALNYKDGETINGLFKHHASSNSPKDLVPCSDAVGVVVAVGDSVTRFVENDRVLSLSYPTHLTGQIQPEHLAQGLGAAENGVLCQYRVFGEDEVVHAPNYLSDVEACTLQIAGTTAWMAFNWMQPLHQPNWGNGRWVLLQGTGGVSIMGLLLGKALGWKVIVTSSSDEKLDRAKKLSADVVINYKTVPDWHEAVMEFTAGHGADLIFENGGAQTTSKSFSCVAWGGMIASIGYVSGKTDPPEDRLNINVRALMRNFTLKGHLNGPRDRFEEMLKFCKDKEIRPVVDKKFGFAEAKEALNCLWSGGHFSKIVITVRESN
jgi:NADPH:quinone reductase-like Zn-dependent oxidoreductase